MKLKKIILIFLLLGSACKPDLPSVCKFRYPDDVVVPGPERVFAANETKYMEFQKDYWADHSEDALKNWLISTKTLSAEPMQNIKLTMLSQYGPGHLGIYRVSLEKNPSKSFILKISGHDYEAQRLFQLQGSVAGNPDCLLRSELGLKKIATKEEVARFPRLAKIYEAASFAYKPKDKQEGGGILRLGMNLIHS